MGFKGGYRRKVEDQVPLTQGGNVSGTLALVRRAINQEWPITLKRRREIMDDLFDLLKSEDVDTRIQAIKTIIASDVVNARRQQMAIDAMQRAEGETVNVKYSGAVAHVHANVETIRKALKEPRYLEYLEQRAMEEDRDPSAVCEHGQQGPVENGKASNGHQPGTNGHRNGSQ